MIKQNVFSLVNILFALVSFSSFAVWANGRTALGTYESEVQWSLCEDDALGVLEKFGYDSDLEFEVRTLRFMEQVDFHFIEQGVIFRTMQSDQEAKSTIKTKFADPSLVDWEAIEINEPKCEWDRYLHTRKFTCNLSHKTESRPYFVRAQLEGLRKLKGLDLSADVLKTLPVWGPVSVKRWELSELLEFKNEFLDFVLEQASIENHSIIELSVRVNERDEEFVMQKMNQFLKAKNISLCQQQQGRTRELLRRLIEH